jgi:GTPase SAR1 family protein
MCSRKLKITIVGDSYSGKDFLCHSFLNLELPQNYTSVSDCYAKFLEVDRENFELEIW